MINDFLIDTTEISTLEDLTDYYVEQSTSIRELQLRMWFEIGKFLDSKSEEEIKEFSKMIKKHLSEVETAIKFFEKYQNFENFPFDKSTSWQAIKKILGTYEKRERKTLKEIVKKRYEENISKGMEGDDEAKIRAEEDEAILQNETTP